MDHLAQLLIIHDELYVVKVYNIVSGQSLDDSIKDSLLSLEEAGKQLMFEYMERMSTITFLKYSDGQD